MRRVGEFLREHPILVVLAALFVAYQVFGDSLPSINLEKALDDISETLGKWTYLAVGVLAFLETGAFVGLVFPGETAVIVAGAIAGQGTTSIFLTITIVWFSAWAGDTASFFIGRKLGRNFILRHGHRVRITEERFSQVEDYFAKYGGRTILVGRFLGLVRALAPFIAGSSGMTYRAFVPYSVLGTGLWAATFSVLGFVLAENLHLAEQLASRGIFVFGAVVVVLVGSYLAIKYMRVEENRSKLARQMERSEVGRRLVDAGRRIEPQARFLWDRVTPGDLGLEFTTLMAVLAVSLFIVVGYGVSIGDAPTAGTAADRAAFDVVSDISSSFVTDLAEAVTQLGGGVVTLLVALVAGVALGLKRRWPELAVLVATVILLRIGVHGLKEIVGRDRPANPVGDADGNSWPSGHAAYAVIYPWLALVITARLRPGTAYGTALIAAGVALAAAIALSRVYLRVHYLSDVTSGAALGVALFTLTSAVALVVVHVRDNGRDP
ncbi:hypothetical protein BH24ACT23_BH24ACT23_01990 [soil metagenome]